MSGSLSPRQRRNRNLLIMAVFVLAAVGIAAAGWVIFRSATNGELAHGKITSLREVANLEQNAPEALLSLPLHGAASWRREQSNYYYRRVWQMHITGNIDLEALRSQNQVLGSHFTAQKPIGGIRIDENGEAHSLRMIQPGQECLMFSCLEREVFTSITINLTTGEFFAVLTPSEI
jgi:hypothetical protein